MADFQVRAVSKYILGSPIKMRRVVNSVRGLRAQEALEVLELLPQRAAVPVAKTIKSALALGGDSSQSRNECPTLPWCWKKMQRSWRDNASSELISQSRVQSNAGQEVEFVKFSLAKESVIWAAKFIR